MTKIDRAIDEIATVGPALAAENTVVPARHALEQREDRCCRADQAFHDYSRIVASGPVIMSGLSGVTSEGDPMTGSTRHHLSHHVRACHRTTAPVWLRLVGPLEVCRGGEPLSGTAVGNRKARALLALLALRRGSLIGVATVVDTLWSEGRPRDPAANVATMVSRLRASLGAEVVLGGRSGYRLGEAVGTDLDDSAKLVTTAQAGLAGGTPDAALSSARQALALLDDGPLLADFPDAGWSMPSRAHHTALLRQARLAAAAAALRTGDVPAARDAAAAAAAADPLDESAVRALMRAYVASGEPAKALIAYGELRATLADELGIDPTTATAQLHVAILRGAVNPLVGREIGPRVG